MSRDCRTCRMGSFSLVKIGYDCQLGHETLTYTADSYDELKAKPCPCVLTNEKFMDESESLQRWIERQQEEILKGAA